MLNKKELDNFLSKIVKNDNGCWEWIGTKNEKGYGRIKIRGLGRLLGTGNTFMAHRISKWCYDNINLQDTRQACHKCDNPSCVNPNHIFMGTAQDNVNDMLSKGRHKTGNQKGSCNGNSKLSTEDVLDIKNKLSCMTNIAIAEEYGIHHSTVSAIRRNKIWKQS